MGAPEPDSTGRTATQRTAHVTAKRAVAFDKGLRSYLGVDADGEVIVRVNEATGELSVANAALLAFALDTVERLEAALTPATQPAASTAQPAPVGAVTADATSRR